MRIYTVEEAATLLGISPHTVRNKCHQKKISYRIKKSHVKKADGTILLRRQIVFDEKQIKAFIDGLFPST